MFNEYTVIGFLILIAAWIVHDIRILNMQDKVYLFNDEEAAKHMDFKEDEK